jgi:hypothetical protein
VALRLRVHVMLAAAVVVRAGVGARVAVAVSSGLTAGMVSMGAVVAVAAVSHGVCFPLFFFFFSYYISYLTNGPTQGAEKIE